MSDAHYTQHARLPQARHPDSFHNMPYATSSYANGHAQLAQRPPYTQSPTSQAQYTYPMPQANQGQGPQIAYAQTHHRSSSSISASQIPSPHHYPHAQSSPMPTDSGHRAPQSYLPASQYASSGQHTPEGYNTYANPADYPHRPATAAPSNPADYYYGHEGQLPTSSPPERPFPCDMCALSFNRQHDLKRHRDTHSGERPFLCNGGCGKTFTRKDALKRHQLVKNCGRAEE